MEKKEKEKRKKDDEEEETFSCWSWQKGTFK